ncbi:hypothetical protein SAMN05421802_11171, partial [Corynebacterium afermentans]
EEINDEPGEVPAEQPKAEAQAKVEDVKPAKAAKAEAPQQADNQVNIAAIIGGVSAALAALGIGAAFLAMR